MSVDNNLASQASTNLCTQPFRVCLLGAPLDTGNMGVTALATSLIHLILKLRPDAQIALFIGNQSQHSQTIATPRGPYTVNIQNYRRSLSSAVEEHIISLLLLSIIYYIVPFQFIRERIKNSNRRIKFLCEANFIGDIRGGDGFSDIYGLYSFLHGSTPFLIAYLLGNTPVLLPQTYGPFNTATARFVARMVLRSSSQVLSRDPNGINSLVKEKLLSIRGDSRIAFCPDVAFSLEAIPPSDLPKLSTLYKRKGSILIGLNISGLLYNAASDQFGLRMDYRSFVHKLCRHILINTDAILLLVPHTFVPTGHPESDPDACRVVFNDLATEFQARIHLITEQYDAATIKSIIGLTDFFVGSRMHACIAALSQGIPTVGVAYSDKFNGVFESVSLSGNVVDARTCDTNRAIDSVYAHFLHRESIGVILNNSAISVRLLINQLFTELLTNKTSASSDLNLLHTESLTTDSPPL